MLDWTVGKSKLILVALLLLGLLTMVSRPDPAVMSGVLAQLSPDSEPREAAVELPRIPVAFLPNEGQIDESIKFYSSSADYSFYLSQTEVTYAFLRVDQPREKPGELMRSGELETGKALGEAYALKVRFLGANPDATLFSGDKQPGEANYFIGNDPAGWVTNVSTYDQVTYEGIYDGINLTYAGDDGKIKYEFLVSPGADISSIRLGYAGADSLALDKEGDLRIGTPWGDLIDNKPVVYQMVGSRKVPREATFKVNGSVVGFSVPSYDRSQPLFIDPTLTYSGFVGGTSLDWVFDAVLDGSNNYYVTGYTFSTSGFSTTAGAYDVAASAKDGFIMKIDPTGSTILYSTYFGGSASESSWAVTVDSSGTAYVTGETASADFPTTAGAYSTSYGGGAYDAFVFKLNPAGGGVSDLIYSSYLGGADIEYGNDIMLDDSDTPHIVGGTRSGDFPTTAGAYDTTQNGDYDAFIAKLDPAGGGAGDLLYSSFVGGASEDYAISLALDGAGVVHTSGRTSSAAFPTTAGAYDTVYGGAPNDGFVVKLDPAGGGAADLSYSSYLGGSGADTAVSVALDGGDMVVTGSTTSSIDFPTTAGAYDTTHSGSTDVYVSRLDPAGGGSGDLVYSTFIGGSGADNGLAVALDSSGTAYITGRASAGFPATAGAYDLSHNGGSDAFVARLSMAGAGPADLLYSTFLGGTVTEYGYAISLDTSRNVYLAGYTSSAGFPTTGGVFDATYGGGGDGFATKLDIIPPATVTPDITPPTSVTVVGFTPAADQISLFWSESSDTVGVAGYKIYNADTSAELADTPDTSHTFSGLSSSVTYAYYVRAYDAADNYSLVSNTVRMAPGISAETSAGVDRTVNPIADVSLIFTEVTGAGETVITKDPLPLPGRPTGFEFSGYRYNIDTTATYTPPIIVAISYLESEITGPEEDLTMLHFDKGWQDVTLYVDTVNNIIVGQVDSFSPVVIAWAVTPATGFDLSTILFLATICLFFGSATIFAATRSRYIP